MKLYLPTDGNFHYLALLIATKEIVMALSEMVSSICTSKASSSDHGACGTVCLKDERKEIENRHSRWSCGGDVS